MGWVNYRIKVVIANAYKHLLCAKHSKCFKCTNTFNLHNNPMR